MGTPLFSGGRLPSAQTPLNPYHHRQPRPYCRGQCRWRIQCGVSFPSPAPQRCSVPAHPVEAAARPEAANSTPLDLPSQGRGAAAGQGILDACASTEPCPCPGRGSLGPRGLEYIEIEVGAGYCVVQSGRELSHGVAYRRMYQMLRRHRTAKCSGTRQKETEIYLLLVSISGKHR